MKLGIVDDLREGSNFGGVDSFTDGTATGAVCSLAINTGVGRVKDISGIVVVSNSDGCAMTAANRGGEIGSVTAACDACSWTLIALFISLFILLLASQL